MRRIYESDALDRDDDDPFRPNRRDRRTTPRAARTVPAGLLSSSLVPERLRRWSISLDVSTARAVYRAGTPISFTVTMKNAMPFPVTIPTRSRLLWSWHVDGYREASHVAEDPPAEPGELTFERGERKRFERTWPQLFHVSESRWEEAPPGEYTISAAINVDGSTGGVEDATTVRIE
jgi:hypothetical protein